MRQNSDIDHATASGLWVNARLATFSSSGPATVEAGALAVENSRIVYCGPEADLPSEFRALPTVIDCGRRWIQRMWRSRTSKRT